VSKKYVIIDKLSIDTTSSNTSTKAGACALLQQKLQMPLISLACRHHALKLIIATVFNLLTRCSGGPNIKWFERFSQAQNQVDKSKPESIANNEQFQPSWNQKLSLLLSSVKTSFR
jgi:hypothetical protein